MANVGYKNIVLDAGSSKLSSIAGQAWKSIPVESEKDMRSIGWWMILRENGIGPA